MTGGGGGGGAETIFGGTDKFYGREVKKRSLSWPFTFFRSTSLAREGGGGHAYCLAGRCEI